MSAKTSDPLTPEQLAWGAFYAKLHRLAEQIRAEQAKVRQEQTGEAKPEGEVVK